MKVLIVYAHPNLRSFNRAVLEASPEACPEGRHTYEVVDLYISASTHAWAERTLRT